MRNPAALEKGGKPRWPRKLPQPLGRPPGLAKTHRGGRPPQISPRSLAGSPWGGIVEVRETLQGFKPTKDRARYGIRGELFPARVRWPAGGESMCEGLREVGQSKLWPESAKEGPRGTSFPEGTPNLAGHRHSSAASKEQGGV